MSKKILICSDSFGVTDPDYPNIHWSEKILNQSSEYKVINLSAGGCSNARIAWQLLQGLKFNPDFVIFSFTSSLRYEYDSDELALPNDLNEEEISHYIKSRYTSNVVRILPNEERNKITDQWIVQCVSQNMEQLKNYFMILFCLMTVSEKNIPFCFSLGGFEYKQEYASFLKNNYIKNSILDYQACEIHTNLWSHSVTDSRPYFHVPNPAVHTLFANECIKHIENSNKDER